MEFGEVVKTRRRALGLTLEDVAESVGVDRATVLRWERGDIKNARRDKLSALAARLCVPVSALLGAPDGLEPGGGSGGGSGGYEPSALHELPVMNAGEATPSGPVLLPSGRCFPVPAAQLPDGVDAYFLWEVSGEAMYPRFLPGDLVLVRRSSLLQEGRPAVFWLGGAPCLRIGTRRGGTVVLLPVNPEYPEKTGADLLTLGTVVALFRSFS